MFRIRGYVKDYELQEQRDKNGNKKKVSVYIGDWYVRTADEEMHQRLRRIYGTTAVLLFLLFLGLGLLQNAGNRNMINALSYACSCFPIVYNLIGMAATLHLPKRAQRREVDLSIRRMQHSATGILVLYPIAAASEIVSLFFVKTVVLWMEMLYFALCIGIILIAWLIRFLCRKYPYRKETT